MTPTLALQSEVFRIYLIIVVAVMAGAGLALSIARYALGKNVASAWKKFLGWLIIIPLVLGSLFLGRVATIICVTLVSIGGFKEFARATGLYKDWWLTGAVYLALAALAIICLIPDPRLDTPGWYGMFMTLPVYTIALLLFVPILFDRTQGQLQSIALSILGFVYFGWMFGHLSFLANASQAYGYLLFLILAVEINDVAAYACGKLFGRRKLRAHISPNKTWGGALGGLAVSMALPWLLGFSFPHFGTLQKVLTGLIVGIGGQLGDLTISFIKRDIGIKDMGASIPGHGGLLDRIDSLIFCAPLFFHMLRWFYAL